MTPVLAWHRELIYQRTLLNNGMTEKEALIILNALPDLGPVRIKDLMARFSSAVKTLEASANDLSAIPGIGRVIAGRILKWREHFNLEKEYELMDKYGVAVVTVDEKGYPPLLREIYDPPAVLYIRGSISLDNENCIAIVGARRASYYGINTARRLARELCGRGFCIISGCARGIDTAAHEGAITAKGTTIAVFGCGIDRIYPPENGKLVEKIVSCGAVVTEFPLGTPPQRQNFPRRNRIISGLSRGVIVVEAGNRSGSLITARMAAEQGREVFSVPGRIDAMVSKGANILIKYGAKPVLSVEDVTEELIWPAAEKGKKENNPCDKSNVMVKIPSLSEQEEKREH